MNFKIGDKVTRNSYHNDIVFVIKKIENDVAYLKGNDVRLYADSPLNDLIKTDKNDDFIPNLIIDNLDRDEFFYLPGKVLHLDGDPDYLNKSLKFYEKCGVKAIGKNVLESDMPRCIRELLEEYRPDILVITGHDSFNKTDKNRLENYKNSAFFCEAIYHAREYEKSHEKLVIIAGACQSDYEDLIKSGANFASSPKRVNIHALDPSIIAVNIAMTDKSKIIDIKNLLDKTKYGSDGIGGLVGNGMMYTGYPR